MPDYRLQLEDRWTRNVKEFIAEADRIKDAMAKYDLHVIAYDPGVVVIDARRRYSAAIDIPTWLLKRMMEKVEF